MPSPHSADKLRNDASNVPAAEDATRFFVKYFLRERIDHAKDVNVERRGIVT